MGIIDYANTLKTRSGFTMLIDRKKIIKGLVLTFKFIFILKDVTELIEIFQRFIC